MLHLLAALLPLVIAVAVLLLRQQLRPNGADRHRPHHRDQPQPTTTEEQRQQQQHQPNRIQTVMQNGGPMGATVTIPASPLTQATTAATTSPAGAASSSSTSNTATKDEQNTSTASSSSSSSVSPSPIVIDSSSSSSSSSTNSSSSLRLRFLHGEIPIFPFQCDLQKTILELKLLVASSLTSEPIVPGSLRIIWIFRGQILRDDKTIQDYTTIQQDDIIHVHVVAVEGPAQPQHAVGQQDGLRHRGAPNHGAAAAAAPQGEYLIPPQLPNNQPLPVSIVFRTTFAVYTSFIGILWGAVIVFGNKLFSFNALLCLIFLTGIMVVGVVQALFGPQPQHQQIRIQ